MSTRSVRSQHRSSYGEAPETQSAYSTRFVRSQHRSSYGEAPETQSAYSTRTVWSLHRSSYGEAPETQLAYSTRSVRSQHRSSYGEAPETHRRIRPVCPVSASLKKRCSPGSVPAEIRLSSSSAQKWINPHSVRKQTKSELGLQKQSAREWPEMPSAYSARSERSQHHTSSGKAPETHPAYFVLYDR